MPKGLEIVRRCKHEPTKFASAKARIILTNKTNGSKFMESWNLERVVKCIEEEVTAEGWDLKTGPEKTVVHMNKTVGYVSGKPVSAIKIVSDGRYVHAYPVEE